MAVRPIDGNELVDTLKQIISDYTSHGMYPPAFPIEYAIGIVEKMPTLAPPNESLTLEQLRQMEKPTPVWAKPEKKTIEAWDGYWCICQRGHIITPGLVSMYADKMNGVTFYAYPPAHIRPSPALRP